MCLSRNLNEEEIRRCRERERERSFTNFLNPTSVNGINMPVYLFASPTSHNYKISSD